MDTDYVFNKGAMWAIKHLYSKLPIGDNCDCSADIVYYLEEMKDMLKKTNKENKNG